MSTRAYRIESQTVCSPVPGVAGLYMLIVPSPESHGLHDCLMWVAMPRGVVAYIHKDWDGTAEEACQSVLDHVSKGADPVLNETHDAEGWGPMVYAALDPGSLQGEIIRRYWDGDYDKGNGGWLGRSSVEIALAIQNFDRFLDFLDPEALGILKKISANECGMFPNTTAYNLIVSDDPRRSLYRRQAFAIFPWLARYLCHEQPTEWADYRRFDPLMAFCERDQSNFLSCIDQGLKLIRFLSAHFNVPASALRRTKGLHLTALFKLEHDEFRLAFKSLLMKPGWRYLTREGDAALLAAHYWLRGLRLRGADEDLLERLWDAPASTLKNLTGHYMLPMSELEKKGMDFDFPAISHVRDFLDALTDGIAHQNSINSRKARRVIRRWAANAGPRMLIKISNHWHEKMSRAATGASDLSRPVVTWHPLIASPVQLGKRMIVELNDESALWHEGHAMQHCVGSYAKKCLLYGVRVFSLRDLEGNHISTLAMKPKADDYNRFDLLVFPLEHDFEPGRDDESNRQVIIDRYYYEMPSSVMESSFCYVFMEHSGYHNADPTMDCVEAASLLRDMANGDDYANARQTIYEECIRANATPLNDEPDMTAGTLALESIERVGGKLIRLPIKP